MRRIMMMITTRQGDPGHSLGLFLQGMTEIVGLKEDLQDNQDQCQGQILHAFRKKAGSSA